jgi:hypothetical protein
LGKLRGVKIGSNFFSYLGTRAGEKMLLLGKPLYHGDSKFTNPDVWYKAEGGPEPLTY